MDEPELHRKQPPSFKKTSRRKKGRMTSALQQLKC